MGGARIVVCVVAVALALACSSAPERGVEEPRTDDRAAPPEPVPCGDQTCEPGERCVVQCECCGIPVPREQLKSSYRCEPMPPECSGDPDPTIDCRPVISRPCA